jgi:hypothetical protein
MFDILRCPFSDPVLISMIVTHYLRRVIGKLCPKMIQSSSLPTHHRGVAEFPIFDPASVEVSYDLEFSSIVREQSINVAEYNHI